ncbi:MAG: GtrA family protein [Bacteroidales bacterium]
MIKFGRQIRDLMVNIIDWFHQPLRCYIPEETFRYGATGGFNTVLDIFLYWFMYEIVLQQSLLDLGFVTISPHIAAFLIVFPFTFSTGFLMAKYIAFNNSMLRGRKQLLRYAITVGGAITLNYFFLKVFVEILDLPALLAKVLTTIFVVTYSYLLQRYFTFETGSIKKRKRLHQE